MTEAKGASFTPRYKKEFSIFEDETLEKLKDFRAARSNWITSNANRAINIDSDKGFYKSNEHKARWAFLRKKWFLTFLHAHRKNMRPLRYYTLKKKLSRPSLMGVKKTKQNLLGRGIPVCKTRNSARERSLEDNIDMEKHKKEKKKKRSTDDFLMSILCPSKKAIKNLKAAKLENRMIESCRCDDGKELTVVIKGVCLCDKSSLNKFKLDKVCDEYTKLENKNIEFAKSAVPQAKDSLELVKKRMSRYSMAKESDKEEEEAWEPDSTSSKKIKFLDNQPNQMKENKGDTDNNEKRIQNLGQTSTKFEKQSSVESENSSENSSDQEIMENKNRLEEKADPSKINLFKLDSSRHVKLNEKSSTDLDGAVEKINRNESTLTLFKNRAEQGSNIGLTEEQSDKMKKRQHNYGK